MQATLSLPSLGPSGDTGCLSRRGSNCSTSAFSPAKGFSGFGESFGRSATTKSHVSRQRRKSRDDGDRQKEWILAVLEAHNDLRIKHWTPPLVWSDECYTNASRQAEACAVRVEISSGNTDGLSGKMGQNLSGPHARQPLTPVAADAQRVLSEWYSESQSYDYDHPEASEETQNFTQLLWFGTTSVGMALSRDGKYCIANYFPTGNVVPPGVDRRVFYQKNVRGLKEGRAPWLCMDPLPLPEIPNYKKLYGNSIPRTKTPSDEKAGLDDKKRRVLARSKSGSSLAGGDTPKSVSATPHGSMPPTPAGQSKKLGASTPSMPSTPSARGRSTPKSGSKFAAGTRR